LQHCLLMWHLELHTRTFFFLYKDTFFWHSVTVTWTSLKSLISSCLEKMHISSWETLSTVTSCHNVTSFFHLSLAHTLQKTHFRRGYRTVMRQTYVRMMMIMMTMMAAMTTMTEALFCPLPFFFHICLFIHKEHILTHHLTSAGHTFSTQQYICIPLQTQQMSEGGLSRVQAIYCLHYMCLICPSPKHFLYFLSASIDSKSFLSLLHQTYHLAHL